MINRAVREKVNRAHPLECLVCPTSGKRSECLRAISFEFEPLDDNEKRAQARERERERESDAFGASIVASFARKKLTLLSSTAIFSTEVDGSCVR